MMLTCAPKINKSVILMSTLHDSPDIILEYNATEGSVDAFDQEISYNSCARKSRRWPMSFFFFFGTACLMDLLFRI